MHRLNFNFTKSISTIAIALIIILFFSQFFTSAKAAIGINRQINFQGKLVNNPLSTNVTDTTYTVVFTFYDRESGGTALWQETQSVTTVDGIFRVTLGSVTPFPANFNFNWDGLYLGIEVNAPINDPEMTPRIRMAAVPFAFNAEKVAGLTVQDTSGNASTSGTLQVANGKTVSFADAFTTSGANPLTLATTGTTNVTLPTTGTLLTNTASANQTITSTQTTGNILSLSDSTGLSGGITGFTIGLTSSTNSQNKTGISFDLSGGTGGTYYDLLGSGSTWSITRGGALTVASCSGCGSASGVNWWNQLAGALSPLDTTNDFLLGSTATSSALFSYTGVKTGQTIASSSGNLILMANNGWGGQLGIGTTTITPGFNLSVVGQSIFGNNQAIQYGGNKLIYLNNKTTDIANDNFAIAGSLEANPSGDTSKIYYGGFFSTQSTSGNVQNFTGRLVGFQGQVNHNGTGTLGTARGFAGFITNVSGGTITDSFAGRFGNTNAGAGQITNAYGVYVVGGANNGGGSFLNNYGVYIEDQSRAGSTANYNIYSAGGGSHNYLAGNLGIGTTAVGNAQLVVDQTNFASTGDILSASAAGTTKFILSNAGNLAVEGSISDLSDATLAITDDLSVTGTVGSIALKNATQFNNAGDDLSMISLGDNYGANQTRILAERGAAGTGGDNPTDLSFWTTPDGSTVLTERMRIYYDGRIDLGSTTTGLRVDTDGGLIDIDDAAIAITDGLTVSGAIGANGGITFDQATDTLGAFTMAGNIIGGSFIITDIGSTGTDFDTSGGLSITTDAAGTALTVDNAANASSIFVAEDNNTAVFTIADGGNITATGTLAVNGDSITADGATLTINAGGAVDIQDGLTVDSLTIDTADITWSGTTPTITINAAETFTISNGTAADNFIYNTSTNALTIGDGTNGLTFDIDTGMTYQGSGRPTKKITLNAEYPGAVLTASGSATTNGSMTSDASPSAALSNWRTYYEWSSSQSTLQDYTVVVRVKLPEDFSAWALTNALTISYNTELPGNGSNKMDVVIYNSSTSLTAQEQSTPVAIRTANISASAKTWLDLSIDDSDLNDNGNALNTAGSTAVIYIKMYSKDNNHVQIGDITLSYLSAF